VDPYKEKRNGNKIQAVTMKVFRSIKIKLKMEFWDRNWTPEYVNRITEKRL
jgi:hypothetical protein